jgi:hypothetical protein
MSIVSTMDFLEAATLISVCLGKTEMIILFPFQETYIPYDEALLKFIRYLHTLSGRIKHLFEVR